MSQRIDTKFAQVVFAAALAFPSAATFGAEFWMCTAVTTKIMPGTNEIVTMWGYALDDDSNLLNGCGNAVSVPGPLLTVPPGDHVLSIHLRNGLAQPVSIVIPGQITAMTPVRNTDGRMRSFTHEAAPGGVADYVWQNFSPGTYAYHSGTHPAVQVQMGLYGAVKHDAAVGQAYAGVPYDQDVVMYYSEIDPMLHASVESGNYGPGPYNDPALAMSSTVNYKPLYFLVNGEPYSAATAPVAAGSAGQRTLLRFINMGLQTHVPVLQGMHAKVVAEDGKPYPFAREQYSVMLAASKTKDAVITPTAAGLYPLYDRRLALTNAQTSPGGLLSFLAVGSSTPLPITDTVTILRAEFGVGGLSVWATSNNASAVLSVIDPATNTPVVMGPFVADTGALNGGYHQLTLSSVTTSPAGVSVTSNRGGGDTSAVPFSENPVANAEGYVTPEDTALTVTAAGVLANDLDGGWLLGTHTLQAAVGAAPTNGTLVLNADGSLSYTPGVNFNGADSFTYTANAVDTVSGAVLASSAAATVAITISPVNDAPVSVNDAYVMLANRTLNAAAPGVLANDSDAEATALSVALISGTTHGVLTLSANGSFSYTPAAGFTGIDSFTYQASDGQIGGNVATATITVNPAPNQPPVAVDDYATTAKNVSVLISVLANDTDPDNNIVPVTAQTVVISLQPSRGGTVSVNPATGGVTFTPKLNFRGTDLFKYRVRDSAGALSNVATVRVNVTR